MNNALFVGFKPKGVVCNHFLSRIKRKYKVKKAGFSGTLDPFASGVLILAFGQYTKLFRFLKKAPKTYEATLWLGAFSQSFDTQNIEEVRKISSFNEPKLKKILESLKGEVEFIPPRFSAKKIDGKRAYELARKNEDFELKKQVMQVYDIEFISYVHPFLSFKVSVSEGGYIRSLGQIIADKLGTIGTLSSLKRLNEGKFFYENEKFLNPISFLDLKQNYYLADDEDVRLGKKLDIKNLKEQKNGTYFIAFSDEFAIISIKDGAVKYELNKVKLDEKTCTS